MRRPLLLALLAALVVVGAACQVTTRVSIDVVEDGSGVVTVAVVLDPAAAQRLGDPARVPVEDLRSAGWEVRAPERAEDGSVTFVGRREFGGPDHLASVLAEVGGTDGVFRDVSVEVRDGFGSADYGLQAQVELTGNPEQFSDTALAEALDGLPLARSPEELASGGAADPDAATLVVSVALPGDDPRTTGSIEDGRATWTFPMTGGEPTSERIEVSSTTSSGRTGQFVIIAVVAGVGALAAGAIALVRRRS